MSCYIAATQRCLAADVLVYCSDSDKDLDFEELLDLLLTAGVHPNKRISLGHVPHQEQLVGEGMCHSKCAVYSNEVALKNSRMCRAERDELLRKLQHAVANSITIVVASVFEDKLPSYQAPEAEAMPASLGTHSSAMLYALNSTACLICVKMKTDFLCL